MSDGPPGCNTTAADRPFPRPTPDSAAAANQAVTNADILETTASPQQAARRRLPIGGYTPVAAVSVAAVSAASIADVKSGAAPSWASITLVAL